MIKLEINFWSEHLSQLIYSYFYYCEKNKIKFDLTCNKNIKSGGAILNIKNKKIFFDYSDDSIFMDSPVNYDFYFKRSLKETDKKNNVFPLNFNLPLSYKSLSLLSKLDFNLLKDKHSRTEILRALDIFSYSLGSHKKSNIQNYPEKIIDYGGNVIFQTRLWNPDNHIDQEEKERRQLQNEFRINACRIIKKHFKNSSVGLLEGDLSKKIAPELVLNKKDSNKKNYLNELKKFNIAIADDGLKNTPGWKISEYVLFGKAIVTTPLNISVDNFFEEKNYLKMSNRSSYLELPDKISILQKEKKYLEMGENNLIWSSEYLHPANYLNRIIALIKII